MYDHVTNQYGKAPCFWGRYLNLYPLTSAEVAYLRNKGTGILVLYSGVASSISQGYPGGQTDGTNAVATLEGLQNENGGISLCAIFVDVEQANADGVSSATIAGYFEGFCDAVHSSGHYTPGPDGPPVGGYCNGAECGTSHIVAWQYAEVCPPNICYDTATGTYTVGCVDLDELKPGTHSVLWQD